MRDEIEKLQVCITQLEEWANRELNREERNYYSGYIYGELAYKDAQGEVKKILEEYRSN